MCAPLRKARGCHRPRQLQIVVPAESATFAVLGRHGKHFGEIHCPFCNEKTIIAGPIIGTGATWIHKSCNHSQGIAAGEFTSEITILFKGVGRAAVKL